MLDNDLIKAFLPIINAGLIARGFNNVTVSQSYQPTQQGVFSGPSVYFFKVSDKRYGFLDRVSYWDEVNSQMVHTETQDYETTFQVNALSIQDPSDTDSITASDLVNTVSAILQSDSTVETLNSLDIGILRITDVRNPYFIDDKDRFEASPSFDFTLTHKQIYTTTVPVTLTIEPNIYRV